LASDKGEEMTNWEKSLWTVAVSLCLIAGILAWIAIVEVV
jgi:hypothetical protein